MLSWSWSLATQMIHELVQVLGAMRIRHGEGAFNNNFGQMNKLIDLGFNSKSKSNQIYSNRRAPRPFLRTLICVQ